MRRLRPLSTTSVSVLVIVVGLGMTGGLAALIVPWHPVPGPQLTPVPVEQVFSADEVARSQAYSGPARLLSLTSLAVSLALLAWLAWSARARRWFERLPGPLWLQVPLAVLTVRLALVLVRLPFAVEQQRLRLEFGLSEQAWSAWATDVCKGVGLDLVLYSLGIWVLIGLARRLHTWWPLAAGAVAAGLLVVGSYAYPLLVEPLFNTFTPLPDGQLRSSIMRQARLQHVELDQILVADASRRTTSLNAYVSGFGSSRRVVLYDTLLDSEPPSAVLSVVAHELSHAQHRDVVSGTLLGASGMVVAMGVLGLLLRRRPGVGWVAVVIAAIAWGSVLTSPVSSAVSRQLEARADVDALQATQDPGSFVALQRELTLRSLSDPTPPPVLSWWFGTHPGVLERIAIAQRLGADSPQAP